MANRRSRLTERDLRDTKDQILGAMADHQRVTGQDVDVSANQEFLYPILKKVEIDHDTERDRDVLRPEKRQPRDRKPVEGLTLEQEYAGDWTWNLATDELTQVGGAKKIEKPKPRRVFPYIERAKSIFRMIAVDPQFADWKEKLTGIVVANQPQVWKEQRYRNLLKAFLRAHGDPTARPDPRIIVGGR